MLVAALWCCTWGRGREGAMVLAPLSAGFQSLPPLPTIKLGPSGADSRVRGLVHALGPHGSLQQTLLWGWKFLLLLPQPPQVLSIRGLRLYFPPAGALGCVICHLVHSLLPRWPAAALPIQLHNAPPHWVPQLLPFWVSSPPGCPHLPLLPVWMNVSSLTSWSLDFHTVRFSVGSGCFLFLNCCCPSFGCTRRHSVSTYASILAGSGVDCFKQQLPGDS